MCACKILATIKKELTQELLVLLNLCADVYLSWPLLLLLLLACPCWCAIGHPFNFVHWLQPEKNAVSLTEMNCHFWSTPSPGPWHIFPFLKSNTLMWKWSYCNGKRKNWLQRFLSGEKSQTSHDSVTSFSLHSHKLTHIWFIPLTTFMSNLSSQKLHRIQVTEIRSDLTHFSVGF